MSQLQANSLILLDCLQIGFSGEFVCIILQLAPLSSFLYRVQPLLDAMKRLLHPVVAVSGLRAPLVDQEGGKEHQHEHVQELGLPVLQAEGEKACQVGTERDALFVLGHLVLEVEPLHHRVHEPGIRKTTAAVTLRL